MGYAALVLRETADTPYASNRDVPSEDDVIEGLGDEIAHLAAHIHAATHRLLVLIARFDGMRGWERSGYRDCADWLSSRTGIDRGASQEKVRAARVLLTLPETSAAMARGELSFSQVRALTRAATPENERALLDLAREAPTATLERMIRAWKKGTRQGEADRERERFESRTLSIFPDDDGMYAITGRLTPEVGALLMRALEAAGDALFRGAQSPARADDARRREAGQRRADAAGLLAERALAAGFGATADSTGDEPDDDGAPISGCRAERYQVVLHVEPATLSADEEPGRSELEDGTRLSAESARRLSCDASVVRVAHGRDGNVLDVGRKTRSIPPALRRALETRDRGCRFPRCGRRFTDGHHVKHWSDGGRTSLDNTLLLCRHHHRLVHEGGWRVQWCETGLPVFIDPRGGTNYEGGWTAPVLSDRPVESLMRENALQGARPDPWTAGPRRNREGDIPKPIYLRACEAF